MKNAQLTAYITVKDGGLSPPSPKIQTRQAYVFSPLPLNIVMEVPAHSRKRNKRLPYSKGKFVALFYLQMM